MINRRSKERRKHIYITQFPMRTRQGNVIVCEHRRLPTRRLNDIKVEELSYSEFIAQLRWGGFGGIDQSR